MKFQREVPVRHEVDVFVAGGGPAGCAAAWQAARQGASVFLAEGQGCFGGMGTSGLVPAFMQFGDGVTFLAAGFGEHLLDRLIAAEGTPRRKPGEDRTSGYTIRVEVLKRVYDEMIIESGVTFSFHTHLIGVEAEGGTVSRAILWGKSGLFAVQAKQFIDATGDGDLAVQAGASFEKGDDQGQLMPGTLCSIWADVDFDKVIWEVPQGARIEEAYRAGVFQHCDKHLPGIWKISEGLGGGNVGHAFGVDATDERSLTQAMVGGRQMMMEYQNYYHQYVAGFSRMKLVSTGAVLGVRETRRIMGDYMLNVGDFTSRAVFADEIGRYCYPIDIHVTRPNDETEYKRFEKEFAEMRYKPGESYGIPYRSLVPRGLDNVLVAGRCISVDRLMLGSIRVMPGCFITGQAAGMAAAMAAAQGVTPRELDVSKLQAELVKAGACLPNTSKTT
ncbi:MAG: FAD-dependent oxidoreductase [bacterium]